MLAMKYARPVRSEHIGGGFSNTGWLRPSNEMISRFVFMAALSISMLCQSAVCLADTTTIFSNDRIGFGGSQSREIQQTVTFPDFKATDQITFDWDILGDQDPWDRAGSMHVILDNGQQVHLGKFITGFNGTTTHSQDISDLAPLLSGKTLVVEAFIDTWVADAWNVNASITTQANSTPATIWSAPLISRDGGFGWHNSGEISKSQLIRVPGNLGSTKLTYFTSGHHHDQTSASDEFNQRRHHLYVDGEEVWTGIPWRTDGPNFRSVNPTSARWDGNDDGDTSDPYPTDYWSSDFPRSGWVPGDEVTPYEIDVSEYLTRGRHEVELVIEDVDINSFWRVSAYLSGTVSEVRSDLDGDGDVDQDDWTVFSRYQQEDFSSFSLYQQAYRGDLDSDGDNDYQDFVLFKADYLASQGVPLNATAVPEPTSLALLVLAAIGPCVRRRRRS